MFHVGRFLEARFAKWATTINTDMLAMISPQFLRSNAEAKDQSHLVGRSAIVAKGARPMRYRPEPEEGPRGAAGVSRPVASSMQD